MITPEQKLKLEEWKKTSGYVPPAPQGSWYEKVKARVPVQETIVPETPTRGERVATTIKTAGETAQQAIAGEGQFAGQGPIQRGVEATAAAFGAVPKVAMDVMPEPVRKGLESFGELIKQGFDIPVEALSKTKLFQEAAQYPEYTKTLESILGTVVPVGEIAGTIAAAGTVKPTVDIAKAGATKLAQEAEVTARMGAEKAKEVTKAGITKTGETISGIAKGTKGKLVRGTDEAIQFLETGTLKDSVANVDKIIDTSIERAVRPSVVGKQSISDVEKYKAKSREAVKTIVENKENIKFTDDTGEISSRLPESLNEFGKAVEQTKSQIYKKYNELSKQAGATEAKVNLNSIADELDKVSANEVLSDVNPSIIKYAEDRADTFRKRGAYTPEQTEEAIKFYNQSLDAFYKNPSYDNASKVSIDALIVNKMRQGLDNVIETATGSEYQALKNQYGALKTIEKDIAKRSIVEGRKNAKGLIDYTDIFSAGDAITSIATMNPALMAKAGTQFAIKEFYKRWVSPDATIKRMFESVDKATNKSQFPVIEPSKMGLSIADISKKYPGVSREALNKIHPDDIGIMIKFIDNARIKTKLSNAEFEMAEKLAEKFDISMDKGLANVANDFAKILEGKKTVTGTAYPGSIK